jgi:hypothetical protein
MGRRHLFPLSYCDRPAICTAVSLRLLACLLFAQPPQGILTGGAQRREVDLHYVPKPVFPDCIVLVT